MNMYVMSMSHDLPTSRICHITLYTQCLRAGMHNSTVFITLMNDISRLSRKDWMVIAASPHLLLSIVKGEEECV